MTYPEQLLETIVFDSHVLDRVQHSETVREPPLRLGQGLLHAVARVLGVQVLGEVKSDLSDGLHTGESHGDDFDPGLLSLLGREHSLGEVLKGLGRSRRSVRND